MHLFTQLRAKVALLIAGAALWSGQAWAEDASTTYIPVSTIDFENSETFSNIWSLNATSKVIQSQGSRTVNGVTTHFYCQKDTLGGNRLATYTFDNSNFLNAAKWKLEFAFAAYSANTDPSLLYIKNGDDAIITISAAANASTATITDGKSTSLGSISIDPYTRGTTASVAVKTWYHLTLWEDGIGVYCSITDDSGTVVLTQVNVAETGTHPTKLQLQAGKALGQVAVDDIVFSVVPEGLLAPSITFNGASYSSNVVTITNSGAGSIKYKLNDEETVYDYTDSFTIEKTTKITAWTTDGETNSSEVSETIIAGTIATPVIYRPITVGSNNTASISDETTAATIMYKVGDGDYTAYPTSGVTFDAATTITAQAIYEEGDKTFKSEEVVAEVTAPVELESARTIDFSTTARGTAEINPTLSDEASTTINDVDYYALTMGDYGTVADFAVTKVEPGTDNKYKWWLRKDLNGLFLFTSEKTANVALLNLKAGQYVKITGRRGNADFRLTLIDATVAKVLSASTQETSGTTVYVYEIQKDGDLAATMINGGYIDQIEIFSQPSTSIDVAVSSVGYSTFYSDQPTKIPNGVTAYTAKLNSDQSALDLAKVTTVIPAKTAVILQAEEGTYTFEPTDDAATTDDSNNDLQGTTTALTTANIEGTVYVLSAPNGENVGFYKYTGETLAANKAYLVLDEASEAPVVRFNFGDGEVGNVSGIESIAADNAAPVRLFDLQGRVLRQAPQHGMFIQNGHKVIR